MWIEITQEDVDRANEARKESRFISKICPTAQSLSRLYPVEEVSVGAHIATVGERTFLFHYPLIEQVEGWSYTKRFKPGRYSIEEKE